MGDAARGGFPETKECPLSSRRRADAIGTRPRRRSLVFTLVRSYARVPALVLVLMLSGVPSVIAGASASAGEDDPPSIASPPGSSALRGEPSGSVPAPSQTFSTPSSSGDWVSQAGQSIEASEYQVTRLQGAAAGEAEADLQAPNRAHGFRTYFGGDRVRLVPRRETDRAWELGLSLLGYGRGADVRPVAPASPHPSGARVDYARSGLAEWYVNDPRGLEQGFTLSGPPEMLPLPPRPPVLHTPGARRGLDDLGGFAPAFLVIELTGNLAAQLDAEGKAIDFAPPSGGPAIVRLAQLEVRDAFGSELPAWMEGFHEAGVRGVRLVWDDREAVYPVVVDPLATSASWSAEGDLDGAHLGWSVASAGDVNDDGYDDVIVGAPDYDAGAAQKGRAFVFHGSPSGLSATPAWFADGQFGGDRFGHAVAAVGDLDGDHYGEVIVGAPEFESGRGRVYIYYGSMSGLEPGDAGWMAGGTTGAPVERFGYSVASAGDVDADDELDVIVGAPDYDAGGATGAEGRAYVFQGRNDTVTGLQDCTGACSSDDAEWKLDGDQADAGFGHSVAGAGDFHADSYDEVIIGAPYYDNGQSNEGSAFVYRGSSTGFLPTPYVLEPDLEDANFGWSVSSAGDVNNDTHPDVVVGAPGKLDPNEPGDGRVFVYHGGAPPDSTADWTYEPDLVGALLGYAVAAAGDVDGDGVGDLLVGAKWFEDDAPEQGAALLFYGSSGDGLGPAWAWRVLGSQYRSDVGHAVAGAGDVNGDGLDDLIVGAPRYYRGEAEEGRALVFHGAAGITNSGLNQQLGLDPGLVTHTEWGVESDGTPLDTRTEAPDAVAYGSLPGSVLLTTGRASDEGLGDTDWAGDGQPDTTSLEIDLNVPPGKMTLCFTAQFVTVESDALTDQASFQFSHDGAHGPSSDVYVVSEHATSEKNPPATYCIDVRDKNYVHLKFEVEDGGSSGSHDSGLMVSRFHYSNIPLPADLRNPDDIDDDGCFHNPTPHDVSAAAGTYSYSKPLIEVPGVSMPFNFTVRYSSGSTKDDVLGQGWAHSYLGEAWKMKDDDGSGYPDRIIARPGGGASYFKEKETTPGVYVYEPQHGGEYSSLTLNADGTIDYTTKDHRVHHFGDPLPPPSRKYLLSWIEDANGNRLTFSYDADNRLEQVTDTRGGSENTFVFDYPSSGSDRLQSVTFDWTDSLGQSRQSRVDFEYDAATGYLSSLTDLNGEATTFTYTRDGRLLAATDADGITFVGNTYEEYQGLGLDQDGYRLYSQRDGRDPDPFDAEAGVSYAYEGELLVLADRLDRQQTTAHDARGRRAWTINAMGVFEEYTYDRNNSPLEIRRKLPSESESRIVQSGVFDEAANPVEQVRFPDTCAGGANQGEECSEDADCPLSSCGVSGTMAYDLRHNLISRTDHYGNTTTLDYDANNNLLRERDPLGHEMSHVYATVPGGASVHPGPISTTDARGNLFRAEYDLRGYLTAAIGPLGGRTEHAYNDLGHRISTVDPEGHRICFEYDDGGRLIAETAYCDTCYGGSNHDGDCTSDGDCPGGTCGLTSTMTYDAKGNQLTRVDPDGATTTTEYTPTGQTAREIDALGHSLSYEYDAGDRLSAILVNNPAERVYGTTCPLVTAHVHDDGDHLTAASVYVPDGAQCADATPALAEAFAEYDEIGNRTSLTDPNGHVTTYTYDLLQRLASETDGLGTVSFTYDARDLMTSRMTAAGDTIQYTYDARGLLTRVDFPGDGISHVLDANGNRVSSERDSAAGPVTRTFDALDRMVSRTDEYGHTVGYEYDLAGNLTRLVYPSGVEVLYEYDGLNRLKAVCDWNCDPDQCKADRDDCTVVYAYDVAGNLTSARLPDGATVSYSYDAVGRLTGVEDRLGTQTNFRGAYALNAAGKRIAADLELPLEPEPEIGRTDFSYAPPPDGANVLESRARASGASAYTYDADGNMLTGTLGGAARTISYNALGQLKSYDATFYRYDADGLRVETALGDKVRRHAYDVTSGHARLLEERDGQGNLVARYVYGIGLLARDGPEGPRIYHYDSRGSTVALTDGAGTVTDRYAYGPYGQLLESVADVDLDGDGNPDPTENPFTYAGRDGVQNDGNGLYYMRARYYAPELGRFIQKDQIFDGSLSVPQSLNRFSYVEGDPVLLTDPNGDFIFTLIATIVVTAVIAASINVAVECADGDGCDAEEVFETIGTSIVESIPVVGTVYHGVTMGMSGEWDWLTFGTSVVSDVATFATLGAGASASAGYEALRGASKATAQFAKTGSKMASKQVSNLLRGFDKAKKAHKAFKTVKNIATLAKYVGRGARMIFGGSDSGGAGGPAASTGPDASGTATDSLNPVACPQPGGTESTGFCGVKCEVWR